MAKQCCFFFLQHCSPIWSDTVGAEQFLIGPASRRLLLLIFICEILGTFVYDLVSNIVVIGMSPQMRFVASLLSTYLCLTVDTVVCQDNKMVVQVVSGDFCTMQCNAQQQPGVQYISVKWYKVIEDTRYGLLTKRLPNGTTRWYDDADRRVQLVDDSLDVSLPSVNCESGGEYVCHLAAPVGEQNRYGHVQLSVKDCPVISKENHMMRPYMIFIASSVLIVALLLYFMSYVCLKKTLKRRNKRLQKEILLEAPLKPLDKKDLMLIYTLGPKTCSPKHLCV